MPRLGVYDGQPAISSRRGRQVVFSREYPALKGTFGMGAIVLAARPPVMRRLGRGVKHQLDVAAVRKHHRCPPSTSRVCFEAIIRAKIQREKPGTPTITGSLARWP